jgi:hypothetical protein
VPLTTVIASVIAAKHEIEALRRIIGGSSWDRGF